MAIRELSTSGETDGKRTRPRTKGNDGNTTGRGDRSDPVAALHRAAGNQAVKAHYERGGPQSKGRVTDREEGNDREDDDPSKPDENGREGDARTGTSPSGPDRSGDSPNGPDRSGDSPNGPDRSGDANDGRTDGRESPGLRDRSVRGSGFTLTDDRNGVRSDADGSQSDTSAETLGGATAQSAAEAVAGAVESDEWTWKHASESGDSMTFSISEELDVLDQKSPNLKQRAEQHEENMKDPGYHAKTALSGVAGPLGPLAYQWKATDKAETRSSELGVSGSVSPSIEGSVAEVFGQINASLDTGRNESETLRVADEDGGAWKVWNSPGGNTSLQETATDFGSSSLPRREKLLEVGARTRVTDKTVNSGEVSITVAVGLVYVVGGKIERGQSTSVGGGVGAKGAGVEGAIEWSSKVTHEMGQDDQWDQEFRFVATKGDDE